MSVVNCEEWTLLCAAQSENSQPIPFQPITSFPCILLLHPGEPAQIYRDMLDTEALYRFIVLWELCDVWSQYLLSAKIQN